MAGSLILSPAQEVGHLATVSVSSGTEDSAYQAARLCDVSSGDVEAQPAMVTSFAGDWLLDFATATRIDYVVAWHGFTAALNVRFKMGATTATSDMDAGLTIPAKRANNFTVQVFKALAAVSGYSASGKRYGKLSVPTDVVAPAAKLLCYRTGVTLTSGIRAVPKYQRRQGAIVHRTDFGHRWAYDLLGYRRSLTCRVVVPDTDLALLDAWFEACGGSANLSTLILDTAVNEALIGYIPPQSEGGSSVANLDVVYKPKGPGLSEVTFGFETVTSGLPEWT